jgi:hypothetical protein
MWKLVLFASLLLVAVTLSAARAGDAPVPATQEERIAQLEAKLQAALDRINQLEQKVAGLETAVANAQKPNPSARADKPAAQRKESKFDVGAKWSGVLAVAGQLEQTKTSASITAGDGTAFTLATELDNGALWEWDCRLNGGQVALVDARRIRAARGNAAPAGTGAVSGGGTYNNGVLVLRYEWAIGGNILRGTFTLRPQ